MEVSIIVPVYNVAPYIERCLRSVMSQTYTGDMECLLVDDCGSDDSMAIAERMIGAYTGPIRFRILHHDHNRGLSAARNTGTDAVRKLLGVHETSPLKDYGVYMICAPFACMPAFFICNSVLPSWQALTLGVLVSSAIYCLLLFRDKNMQELFRLVAGRVNL